MHNATKDLSLGSFPSSMARQPPPPTSAVHVIVNGPQRPFSGLQNFCGREEPPKLEPQLIAHASAAQRALRSYPLTSIAGKWTWEHLAAQEVRLERSIQREDACQMMSAITFSNSGFHPKWNRRCLPDDGLCSKQRQSHSKDARTNGKEASIINNSNAWNVGSNTAKQHSRARKEACTGSWP